MVGHLLCFVVINNGVESIANIEKSAVFAKCIAFPHPLFSFSSGLDWAAGYNIIPQLGQERSTLGVRKVGLTAHACVVRLFVPPVSGSEE